MFKGLENASSRHGLSIMSRCGINVFERATCTTIITTRYNNISGMITETSTLVHLTI